jgi:hypothetical protein
MSPLDDSAKHTGLNRRGGGRQRILTGEAHNDGTRST